MNYLAEPQRRIKAALLSGIRMTTAQGNRIGQTVDSRKIISRLRKQGMPICSYWNIRKDDSGRTVAKYKTYYYGQRVENGDFRSSEIGFVTQNMNYGNNH